MKTLGGGPKVDKQLPRLAVSWWMCGVNAELGDSNKGQRVVESSRLVIRETLLLLGLKGQGGSAGARTQRRDPYGRNSGPGAEAGKGMCVQLCLPEFCLSPILAWCLSLTKPTFAARLGSLWVQPVQAVSRA